MSNIFSMFFVFFTEGKSVVRFTARTSQDYGTLQCWAENVVGRMTTPCYYHVLPAGKSSFSYLHMYF